MSTGWECPRCHRCYAPFVQGCDTCNAEADKRPDLREVEQEFKRLWPDVAPQVDPAPWPPWTWRSHSICGQMPGEPAVITRLLDGTCG